MELALDHNSTSTTRPTAVSPMLERLMDASGGEGGGMVNREKGGFVGVLNKALGRRGEVDVKDEAVGRRGGAVVNKDSGLLGRRGGAVVNEDSLPLGRRGEVVGKGAGVEGVKESTIDADQKERFQDAARELVGITLVLPILKMARQDPFKSEMFHGGQAEEMFGAKMDEMVATGIASRMDTGLGDAIYRKFTSEGSLAGGLDQHG